MELDVVIFGVALPRVANMPVDALLIALALQGQGLCKLNMLVLMRSKHVG